MEGGQSAHKQAMNISLVMMDLQQNLNKEETFLPHQPEVGHGVAEALDLHGAELVVHGEVCEVHVARGLYCQSEQNGIDHENDCLDMKFQSVFGVIIIRFLVGVISLKNLQLVSAKMFF